MVQVVYKRVNLWTRSQNCGKRLTSFVLSLSLFYRMEHSGKIFIKFGVGIFVENLSRKFKFH